MPIFCLHQFMNEMMNLQRIQQTATTAVGHRLYDLHRKAGGAGLD